jgi:hypothetical protein
MGIMLRPLNVPQPNNLVQIAGEGNRGDAQSYPDYGPWGWGADDAVD